MSLTAALWILAVAGIVTLAAMLFVFVRAWRREDAGTRLFADAPGRARRKRGTLTPATAPAIQVAASLRALIAAAIITEAQRAPLDRWLSDTFVGGIPVMTPEEIARLEAQYAKAGEVA